MKSKAAIVRKLFAIAILGFGACTSKPPDDPPPDGTGGRTGNAGSSNSGGTAGSNGSGGSGNAGTGGIIVTDTGGAGGGCGDCNPTGAQYCGKIGNSCGTRTDCGNCKQPGFTCGGSGIPNVCGAAPDSGVCEPTVCSQPAG